MRSATWTSIEVTRCVEMDYSAIPGLSWYFLEDSFVLGLDEDERSLTFTLELELTDSHPAHAHPNPGEGEQYCYAPGRLVFLDLSRLDWLSRASRVNLDAAGSRDWGNVDFLKWEAPLWRLGGDWGEVLVTTDTTPFITLHRSLDA